jgi:hypothetical protein
MPAMMPPPGTFFRRRRRACVAGERGELEERRAAVEQARDALARQQLAALGELLRAISRSAEFLAHRAAQRAELGHGASAMRSRRWPRRLGEAGIDQETRGPASVVLLAQDVRRRLARWKPS